MANQDANIIKLVGGATETAVDLSARVEVGMLAVCPFEGVLVYKNSVSSFTTYPDSDEVIALIGAFGGIEEAPVDGITYGRKDGVWVQVASTSEVDSKKALWKGYENPEDMHIDLITGDASRTYTVYRGDTTDTVFRCKGVEFSFPTGDPKLSVTLPAVARKYYLYHDDTGQLTYETVTTSDDVVKNSTLAPIIILDTPDAGATWMQISSINRWEDVRSNEIENYASYKTKTLVSTDNQVLFTGVLNGTQVGHGGGTYFTSRDFEFACSTEDIATKVWAKYYLLGVDVDGIVKEQRFEPLAADGVPYYSTGGALQYNFFNTGTGLWEVQPVGNNDFVCCHFLIANGELGQVTTVLGQEDYGTLSQARNGIESEQESLVVSSEIFKEAGIRASCIFKNNAGVGELQYVDTGGVNLFKYILSGVLTGGAPSANLQNLISVLSVTPAGDAGGLPVSNIKSIQVNEGATTSQTPTENIAVGDQGYVSYGGFKESMMGSGATSGATYATGWQAQASNPALELVTRQEADGSLTMFGAIEYSGSALTNRSTVATGLPSGEWSLFPMQVNIGTDYYEATGRVTNTGLLQVVCDKLTGATAVTQLLALANVKEILI